MEFEFDPAKSQSNKVKHGIDFVGAQVLWKDEFYIEVAARSDTESRFAIIGCIGEKHYTAFITYRQEVIRIISVRRSRGKEIELYESRRA